MLLFVYGTLCRGESNHRQLAGGLFRAVASTTAEYELVDMGGYPALLEGGSTAVRGELYEIDPSHLGRLDAFEDVPRLYDRKTVRIGDVAAETYVMRRDVAGAAPRIPSGDWPAHRTRAR
jgi:gamma-glutamylaminecyclotransferase